MWLGILIFILGLIGIYYAYKQWKYERVWLCDGVADDVQINEAIHYLSEGGIAHLNGEFSLESSINFDGDHKTLTGKPHPNAQVLVRTLRKTARNEK